ncbi:MAG TPA: MFS transporter [Nitrospiria bacterium]
MTKNFFLLSAAHFFFGLAFWPFVLLPVFLQDLGADLLIVGVIIGSASLAGIAVRPWVGTALDRIGRRKCLITGGLVFLATNLLYLEVESIGWMIYAIRLLHGLGMGILFATFFTLAADISPLERRTEGIGLFGISGHLSGSVGVMLGETIIGIWGYSGMFISCASLSLLSLLIILRVRDPGHHHHETPPVSFFRLSLAPALRLPLLATIVFAISLSSYMVFLKPYALSVGVGSVTTFFVAYSLSAVGVRLVGGHWPDRFGLRPVLYPSMVLMSLGILLFTVQPTPAGLVISGVLCGTGHGFIFPILSVMFLAAAEKKNRGSLMTLYTMLIDTGLFIGAPLLGLIARGGNYLPMFIVAAALQAASLAAFALLDGKKVRA